MPRRRLREFVIARWNRSAGGGSASRWAKSSLPPVFLRALRPLRTLSARRDQIRTQPAVEQRPGRQRLGHVAAQQLTPPGQGKAAAVVVSHQRRGSPARQADARATARRQPAAPASASPSRGASASKSGMRSSTAAAMACVVQLALMASSRPPALADARRVLRARSSSSRSLGFDAGCADQAAEAGRARREFAPRRPRVYPARARGRRTRTIRVPAWLASTATISRCSRSTIGSRRGRWRRDADPAEELVARQRRPRRWSARRAVRRALAGRSPPAHATDRCARRAAARSCLRCSC